MRILKNSNKFHHLAFNRVEEVARSLGLLRGARIALAFVVKGHKASFFFRDYLGIQGHSLVDRGWGGWVHTDISSQGVRF